MFTSYPPLATALVITPSTQPLHAAYHHAAGGGAAAAWRRGRDRARQRAAQQKGRGAR